MRKNNFLLPFIFFIISFSNLSQAAEPPDQKPHLVADLTDYLTAPTDWTRKEWLTFGLAVGGIYITSESLDDRWKDEMVNESHPYYYKGIDRIGDAWGDGRLSGTFLLGVYGYGHWTHNPLYLNASYDMLQSAAYTAITTQIIKRVFARDRPNAADDEAGWFSNGVSFPSGHTSNAFAISQSFLNSLENPSIGTKILFYGLASATALARTYDNAHWASDTLAGALVGIYTANYVTRLNRKRRRKQALTPFIGNRMVGIAGAW